MVCVNGGDFFMTFLDRMHDEGPERAGPPALRLNYDR